MKLNIRHIPQYILALLLLTLVFLEGWTYYLGGSKVTFKRLTGNEVYKEINDLSLRRYKKGEISPHLFTIKTDNEKALLDKLTKSCNAQKIGIKELPKEADKTDKEMVDVIKKSPYIYLSKQYNLKKPKEGRMCIIFRDKDSIYLFINGNL